MPVPPIHLATVALERNRWGSRVPSLRVSAWLDRIERDGFDGIELWDNHFLAADEAERVRLIERGGAVAVFNSYARFGDTPDDAKLRDDAAAAVAQLRAPAVKYNLGPDAALLDVYRRNLLAWSRQLPESCRLLCECHPGTALEEVDAAAAFFAELDPARFGIIAHVNGDADGLERQVAAMGARVRHLHVQMRTPESDPTTPGGQASLAACVAVLRRYDVRASASVEFTRGIGRDEQIETLYANTLIDLAAYRDAWATT